MRLDSLVPASEWIRLAGGHANKKALGDMTQISLKTIQDAVSGNTAAFRMRARLQPAGGVGDKVFPPTYAEGQDGKKHANRYATEVRVIDGERKPSVLLDSVASQANRMELALLNAHDTGSMELPVVFVDFEGSFPEIGRISALEAPHRVYDAILRDATLEGEAFRASSVGRELTDANARDSRAMLKYCPTALLFGAWDSTGPRGGMGNKFQRALVSEVVGVGFEAGSSVGSRIDPLQIAASIRIDIPKSDSDAWSVDEKGKAKHRPSEVNHSNIAPTRNDESGGVTMEYGLHTAVLSLPALRRVGFGAWSAEQSAAARVLLASLGVLSMLMQRESGYDFRSRCTLVPEQAPVLEQVNADGTVVELEASLSEAFKVYAAAVAAARKLGVEFPADSIRLEPMPKLVQLVEASRAARMAADADA